LDKQIVYVLEVLYFVDFFETLKESYSADVEDMNVDLDISTEEFDRCWLVVLFVEQIEVYVAVVDHKKIYDVFTVFPQLTHHFLLVLFLGVTLVLAHFQLSIKVGR